jgi:hypothetical protein
MIGKLLTGVATGKTQRYSVEVVADWAFGEFVQARKFVLVRSRWPGNLLQIHTSSLLLPAY